MQTDVPSILLSLVFAFVVSVRAESNLTEKPVVTISPASVELAVSSADAENHEPQFLELTVFNRTASEWKFNKFFDCWSPILASEAGVISHLGLSRDGTRRPTASEFPTLAPGESATVKMPFKLVHHEKKIVIVFYDSTGGQFFTPISPGNYKLCIFYRPQAGNHLLQSATEHYALKLDGLWEGWAMSDWIDIHIKP